MERADGVDMRRRSQRERGHVEERATTAVIFTEREKALTILTDLAPDAGEMLFDELKRERVVAGRHGSVRREHGRAPYLLERVIER
jgi:hypothetical protein